MEKPEPKPQLKGLLGVGLDNEDGHKRVTQAEKFAIVGGSAETHERMTETVLKTFEDLKRKGKEIEDAEHKEVTDLLHKHSQA
ncbi:MAG: hypothetical protein AAGF10_01720 [Verrucomicrobiota bacterium]